MMTYSSEVSALWYHGTCRRKHSTKSLVDTKESSGVAFVYPHPSGGLASPDRWNQCAHRQPMIGSPLPSYPWEKVASDLFQLNGVTYLLVVDYFSRYMEVQTLTTTTSASVIRALKATFARHGIPSVLVSDNGPQYSSKEMQEFADLYNFQHITSSPHYPQSNGMAERAVKTAKSLLEKSADPYMALLSYRATPLPWCGLSPAELLMGRCLQIDIPQPKRVFTRDWPYLASFHENDEEQKWQQKAEYDSHHRARPLPPFPDDESVWVQVRSVWIRWISGHQGKKMLQSNLHEKAGKIGASFNIKVLFHVTCY